jgi:predicted small lipoprotein YifL
MRGIAVLASALLAVSASLTGCGAGSSAHLSPADIQASVVDTCQGSVKKQLKDPDSAKFDSWKAWQVTAAGSTPPAGMSFNPSAGDKYYSSVGMVNAKNGFGGYAGDEPYSCDAVVSADENIRARAHSVADLLNGN